MKSRLGKIQIGKLAPMPTDRIKRSVYIGQSDMFIEFVNTSELAETGLEEMPATLIDIFVVC